MVDVIHCHTRTLDARDVNDLCLHMYDECTWASGSPIKYDTIFGLASIVPKGHMQVLADDLDKCALELVIGDTVFYAWSHYQLVDALTNGKNLLDFALATNGPDRLIPLYLCPRHNVHLRMSLSSDGALWFETVIKPLINLDSLDTLIKEPKVLHLQKKSCDQDGVDTVVFMEGRLFLR